MNQVTSSSVKLIHSQPLSSDTYSKSISGTFEAQKEGKVVARLVKRFDPNWLYLLPTEAQRFATRHMENLWKLESDSEEMWLFEEEGVPFYFIGVIPYTYLGVDRYIWTMPFRSMKTRHLKHVRRLIDANMERFSVLVAQVVTGYSTGERFARFFRFEPHYEVGAFTVWVRRNDGN